jgi:hypothetical protein
MTETTTAASKAKTTKHAASSFGMLDYGIPKFEMPKFDLPNMEMPEAFREMAEQGAAHAREPSHATSAVSVAHRSRIGALRSIGSPSP